MVFQNFSYYNFALLFLAYNWNWLLLLISLVPAAQCVPTTRNIIGFDSPNPNFIAGFCKYLSDGFYEYPYDCAAYISCIDSKAELEYCSGDKLFNKALQICDTPDSVDCNELEKPIPDPKCLNAPSGTIFPSIEHCDEFIVCIDQQAVMQKCPDQYLFNPLILICDDPNEVVCYTDQTTTPLTTTQAPSTTTEAYTKCVGQEFGTTFPYIEDCQQYILCLGDDEYYKAKCPINSWYDPKTGECGTNMSPTACQEVETTTTAASTTQSPQDRCANQEFGISYPLVTDCKKYIICLGNGESAIVDCIYNSWYDPATGNCEQNVSPTACQESAITTTTTTAATTATTTTQKPPATSVQPDVEICAGVPSGQYVNYPDNCSKYIICIEPVPIAFHCTKGYFFSAARQQCVDWAQSDCDSSGTTVLPPAAPPPTPAPDTCLNDKGNTLPFTANCQWFIRCINDNVYMMGVCSIGEYYDPMSGSCGGNVSPDACLQRYTTTVSTTIEIEKTSTTTTTTTSQPDPADPCAGIEEGVLVPYPNDCTKFIQCNSPDPQVFNCAQGQEFSPTLKRCMAAWYANCTMTAPTVTPLTSTTKLPNPTPNDICEGKTDGSLIPYPHNCSKYIVCQDPIAVGYDCPDQQEFNSIIMSCTDKQLANCTT